MQSVKQGGIKYHLELFYILLMFYNQYLIQSLAWFGLVWLGLVWFDFVLSTILGYLMSTPYTYILDIWDLVWFGFMAYQQL